jgi:FkbM family methyltransferase
MADLRVPAIVLSRTVQSFRILKRFGRALCGKELLQFRQVQTHTLSLGERDAQWTIRRAILSPDSVIYSFGVGEDISFELALIERFGVTIHAFDPTPRAIAWMRGQNLPPELVFHPFGVGGVDGTCKFSPPRDPQHVSHSLVHRETPWPAIDVPICRLPTICRELGHGRVDLLKMDIEGAEYEVVDDLLNSTIQVSQLLVEFHHRWPEIRPTRTREIVKRLNRAGYQIFHVSPSGDEYSFQRAELPLG